MGFPLANGSIPGFRLRPWIWKVPTPPPNGLRRVDGGLLFLFPEHPARPGLAASQTAQLAGSQARSRPVYQREQAIHVHVRPRKPVPPFSRTPRAWWRLENLPPRAVVPAGVQVQQRARPCGNQAGPRGREELRRQEQGCDLASDPRRCPPRVRPLLHVVFAHAMTPTRPAIQSPARPAWPDPTHGRGVVGLAQLRCRARASYHQLKIRNHLWTCTAQGASLRPRQKFGADW